MYCHKFIIEINYKSVNLEDNRGIIIQNYQLNEEMCSQQEYRHTLFASIIVFNSL